MLQAVAAAPLQVQRVSQPVAPQTELPSEELVDGIRPSLPVVQQILDQVAVLHKTLSLEATVHLDL